MNLVTDDIRLTQFSHGAGWVVDRAKVLEEIPQTIIKFPTLICW
jgi:hypothetical protein